MARSLSGPGELALNVCSIEERKEDFMVKYHGTIALWTRRIGLECVLYRGKANVMVKMSWYDQFLDRAYWLCMCAVWRKEKKKTNEE